MADPAVDAIVSRVSLGLADLDLNDHVNYLLAGGDGNLFGGTVQWRRQTVQSPYVESQITVARVRDIVEDVIAIDCLGADNATVQANLQTLINAFSQDYFNVTVVVGNGYWTYACEASDYTIDFSQARVFNNKMQIKFALRRTPQPINGPG